MLLLAACAPSLSDPAELLLAELDRDGSGDLDASELPARDPAAEAARLDLNASGRIDVEELRRALDRWSVDAEGRPSAR